MKQEDTTLGFALKIVILGGERYFNQLANMSLKVVVLKEASIFQGQQLILRNVNLNIQAKEFVYLVGKTGSGKSSLLKTIYGALPLLHGTGVVAQFDLQKLNRKNIPMLRRKLGIVFQDFNLLMDRTIGDNLHFVLKATGWKDPKNKAAKILDVLEKVGMAGCLEKMPHQLSGGEQQRVVIARALLNNPQLIIADEPTGNLDPDTSADILRLLRSLAEEWNTAVLFATHDYRIMEQFPARTIRCHMGELIEDKGVFLT